MASQKFRIPKQTDENLLFALFAIKSEMAEMVGFRIRLKPHPHGNDCTLDCDTIPSSTEVDYVLKEHSQIMPHLLLIAKGNDHQAIFIQRNPEAITDSVEVFWCGESGHEWLPPKPEEKRSPAFVKLMALARKHLRACDTEGALFGSAENDWSRFRDAQVAILNSLSETQRTSVVEYSNRSIEAEAAAKDKHQRLDDDLRQEFGKRAAALDDEHQKRLKTLEEREAALKAKEESYNTKEARYVARQKQQEQIEQIEQWITNWSLTSGTRSKRWPVLAAYTIGIVASGGFAWCFGEQSIELLKQQELDKVQWWEWTLLALRSVIPFAAFTTFVIYLIRWTSAWARQHAEEEFRNRARLLDIGRSDWLLEAVRDAQDNQRELPAELLKELSRNLFVPSQGGDSSDLHPQAISDVLMQGLSSLRVKSADGTEVEAKRGKDA